MDIKATKDGWYWGDDESRLSGPFETRDLAIDDAVYGNGVFDYCGDGFFLLNGHPYPNPDFYPEYAEEEENPEQLLTGELKDFSKDDALEWYGNKLGEYRRTKPTPEAEKRIAELEAVIEKQNVVIREIINITQDFDVDEWQDKRDVWNIATGLLEHLALTTKQKEED